MLQLGIELERLPRSFFASPTAEVAESLIGQALLHRSCDGNWVGGWIVETEAYLHRRDPASHSARGMTPSNRSMFLGPGTLYVYPIHSRFCLNAVTETEGLGCAVLIRAIEPVWGIESMKHRRNLDSLLKLTRGPAMLCAALGVDRSDDGRCLLSDKDLGIFREIGPTAQNPVSRKGKLSKSAFPIPACRNRRIIKTRRIGITKAAHRLLRFIDANSKFLSRPYRSK